MFFSFLLHTLFSFSPHSATQHFFLVSPYNTFLFTFLHFFFNTFFLFFPHTPFLSAPVSLHTCYPSNLFPNQPPVSISFSAISSLLKDSSHSSSVLPLISLTFFHEVYKPTPYTHSFTITLLLIHFFSFSLDCSCLLVACSSKVLIYSLTNYLIAEMLK